MSGDESCGRPHSYDDLPIDRVDLAMDGRQMMSVGKYKFKLTLEEVYETDKSYIMWVRSHGKSESMSDTQATSLCGTPRCQEVQSSGERGRESQGHERHHAYARENELAGKPFRNGSHLRENAITGEAEAKEEDPPGQSAPGPDGM